MDRAFIHPAADIDRRDKSLAQVSHKARLTGKLSEGGCKGLYAKGRHRNLQIACEVARELIELARAHQVTMIVFEHLKKFRPKGGRKQSALRQRFHGWLHRLIVKRVQLKAEELGYRVVFVNPCGTSKYAFDGSGEVKRDDNNRAWATFQTGKRYNCDLSASYNIAAKDLVAQLVKRAGVPHWRQLLPKGHALYCAASTADRPGAKTAAGIADGGTNGHKSRSG